MKCLLSELKQGKKGSKGYEKSLKTYIDYALVSGKVSSEQLLSLDICHDQDPDSVMMFDSGSLSIADYIKERLATCTAEPSSTVHSEDQAQINRYNTLLGPSFS